MRRWIVLALVACLLVLAPNLAGAKYVSESLTIDGPGMDSAGVIESRSSIDRVYAATLVGGQRRKTGRPTEPGPAFLLHFTFGVGDEEGARTETVDQILYPFARGGPVVRTQPAQGFAMSYGPVRFRPGWFTVPPKALRILEGGGLPHALPRSQPARNARSPADRPAPWLPWFGIALVIAGALGLIVGRRRALEQRLSRGSTAR